MSKIFISALILIFSFTTQNTQAKDNKPTEKEWTFLLFLNGHNNLDSYGAFNINQMEEIGSTDDLNMIVQWASLDNVKTKRLYIEKDSDTSNVTSPAIETLPQVDMGDYKKLVEFVEWGVKKYPAKHYMIAVWNHGSGWHKYSREDVSRDISSDDVSGNKITTEQLALAMEESAKIIGHKVDIYGSDACLMAMIEVAAQMKDSVDYMVASADLEPGEGWPYSTWMARWVAKPQATPEEVSKYLTQEYLKSYYDGGIYNARNVTFSAMNLNHLSKLIDAIKNLTASLITLSAEDVAATKNAASDALSYFYNDYKDLGLFIDNLEKSKANIKLNLLTDVKETMGKVIVENGGTGYLSSTQGISIWLPEDEWYLQNYGKRYSNLKFNVDTNWIEYLKLLTK